MGLSFRARARRGGARTSHVYIEDGAVRYGESEASGPLGGPLPPAVGGAASDDTAPSSPEAALRRLDRARRCTELAPFVPLLTLPVVVLALGALLFARVAASTLLATGIVGLTLVCTVLLLAWWRDRRTCDATLVYHLDGRAAESFLRLQKSYLALASCGSVWQVPLESRASSQKHAVGATMLFRRYQIRVALSLPPRVRCNVLVPALHSENRAFYFFPDRVLTYDSHGVHAVPYEALTVRTDQILYAEDETVPSDACVVDSTWRYVRADGDPDTRYGSNRRLPIVVYGELHLHAGAALDELFHYSKADAGDQFAAAVNAITRGDAGAGDAWGAADDGDVEDGGGQADDGQDPEGLYDGALALVVREGYASLQLLARELRLEFNRAAEILERMERDGYVGPPRGAGSRAVNGSAVRYIEVLGGATGPRPDDPADGGRSRPAEDAPRAGRGRSAYEVLGVAHGASFDEITAAYRRMAQMYHPDKVASLAPEYRRIAERRMREINAAYRDLERRAS